LTGFFRISKKTEF